MQPPGISHSRIQTQSPTIHKNIIIKLFPPFITQQPLFWVSLSWLWCPSFICLSWFGGRSFPCFFSSLRDLRKVGDFQLFQPCLWAFSAGSNGKESACNAGDAGSIPGSGRSTGGGHGNPLQSSCLETPGTEEPGGLCDPTDSRRVEHDWVINTFHFPAFSCCKARNNNYQDFYMLELKREIPVTHFYSSNSETSIICMLDCSLLSHSTWGNYIFISLLWMCFYFTCIFIFLFHFFSFVSIWIFSIDLFVHSLNLSFALSIQLTKL